MSRIDSLTPAARAAEPGRVRWSDCLNAPRPPSAVPAEIPVGVLRGEGVGGEVVQAALDVVDAVTSAAGVRTRIQVGGLIGRSAEKVHGKTLSGEVEAFTEEVFAAGGALLCGAGGGRFVYELRRRFDVFFKISPLRTVNGVPDASRLKPAALADVDILVTRENSGGVYQGAWSASGEAGSRSAEHRFGYGEPQVRRFLECSARLAAARRGLLTVVWKESGVPTVSALWKDCAEQAAGAAGVRVQMVDVDLMAYRLIQEAAVFDVVAAPNMCGDVLADLGAVLLGSRGVSYSGNFTERGEGVYQTNHGAAYDLAGTDRANPAGQILCAAMMLRESFGLHQAADAVETGLRRVWRDGLRTADVAGPDSRVVGTRALGVAAAERAVEVLRERSALPTGLERRA
jgi:3-isopropylmalate dehydrogenase